MSRDYWFISDTHFNHENSLKWGEDNDRGERFSNVIEMNEHMIENWNKVVKPGDIIYHLGDVVMGEGSEDWMKKHWPRLNGSKRLVIGNHDNVKMLARNSFFKKMMLWRVWDSAPLIFSHVPIHQSSHYRRQWDDHQILNVHGHTHEKGSPDGPYRSVCVELNNYTPVNLEELA